MLYEERVKEIIDAKSRELATRHHAHDQKHIVHHRVAPTFANRVGRYGTVLPHTIVHTILYPLCACSITCDLTNC